MKAAVLNKFGGSENFEIKDVPMPEALANEVIIKVKNVGLNPADYKVRQDGAPDGSVEAPVILGWDASGVVEAVGADVTKFKVGDEVFGMIDFPVIAGTYAEFAAAPESDLALKPSSMSFEEAAALTLAPLTAYQALVHVAKVKAGDRVLVNGAAGGTGHIAVQIAKILGAHVIGTASEKNREFLEGLGLDEFIDYTKEDIAEKANDIDVVFNAVRGDSTLAFIDAVKENGVVVSITGPLPDEWKNKRPDVQAPPFLVSPSGDDEAVLAQMVVDGKIKVEVSEAFPLENVAAAHAQLETGRTRGKIVLSI